jgi:hypothetical protein
METSRTGVLTHLTQQVASIEAEYGRVRTALEQLY